MKEHLWEVTVHENGSIFLACLNLDFFSSKLGCMFIDNDGTITVISNSDDKIEAKKQKKEMLVSFSREFGVTEFTMSGEAIKSRDAYQKVKEAHAKLTRETSQKNLNGRTI